MSSTTPSNSSPKPSEEAAPVAVGTHGINIDTTATKPNSAATLGNEKKKALCSPDSPGKAAEGSRVEKDQEVPEVSRETEKMEVRTHDAGDKTVAEERWIQVATKRPEE